MTFSAIEVITGLCVVAMLILNLSLSRSVAQLRVEIANMRADLMREQAESSREQVKAYTDFVKGFTDSFLPRREAEAMHEANLERLKAMAVDLHHLTERVADIG